LAASALAELRYGQRKRWCGNFEAARSAAVAPGQRFSGALGFTLDRLRRARNGPYAPPKSLLAPPESRQQFAVVAPKPPSPGAKGAFPTVLGINPEIGPPFAAAAGVESV
jgi:hypothetical protein